MVNTYKILTRSSTNVATYVISQSFPSLASPTLATATEATENEPWRLGMRRALPGIATSGTS